jgi:hypothetical protein
MQKLYLREADAEQRHDLLILLVFEMGNPKSRTQKTILDRCQTDHSHIWFDEHTELAATCVSVIATNIPMPHLFEMLRRKESPTFAPSCKAYERHGGNPLSYEQNTSVDGFCWGGV